jgi:hypothetical protein
MLKKINKTSKKRQPRGRRKENEEDRIDMEDE